MAVDPECRRPVAALRHPCRCLRRFAAGDAIYATHAHRRGPGPDQPGLPPAPLHPCLRLVGPVPQSRQRRRDPQGAVHPR
ncbi:hypothetical protein G6F46_015381 [Rhizopus delemar]|nr:hypothetical protein G6F46_015381 [Rhizopus delemar]